MPFLKSDLFIPNPEVLYLEAEDKLLLTFIEDDGKIYEIDKLAKDIYLLAVNDFDYNTILETSFKIYQKPEQDVTEEVNTYLTLLIDKNILWLKK